MQLLLLCMLYGISRCFFTIVNANHFDGLTTGEFFEICLHGLRFDISGILAVNALYIFLLLIPLPAKAWSVREKISHYLFLYSNSIALIFEISDWAYFPYNFKRATADVLNMVSRKGDFWLLLPGFIVDYWYVPLAVLLYILVFVRLNRKIRNATPIVGPAKQNLLAVLSQIGLLLLLAGGSVVGIRGGLQYVPINLRNALQATESKFTPIVLNTPFSIINTLQNRELRPMEFYSDEELNSIFNPKRNYPSQGFKKMNVVVVVLESFSKEFTKLGAGQSYTPFLDSLMNRSLTCTQAYANALRSSEGIPAVLSGIPSLMDESISTSIYATNRVNALPELLKKKGYSSAFFHGGTNGTMSFDVYCAGAGFDKYFGRKEYNNDADYDGNWGIWDEPFLQYTARQLSELPEPFFGAVLTLSSHPPYNVPDEYREQLPSGDLPVYRTIAYSDNALRQFFETVSTMPWFNNTLFVLTADHASPMAGADYYKQHMGRYAIPIIYFAPGDSLLIGNYGLVSQQIDILPSILDYLDYDLPFYALGNSIFEEATPRYSINYNNGQYQWLYQNYLMQADENQIYSLYAFPGDSLCRENLIPERQTIADNELLPSFRAFIQEYRNALISNRMFID